MNKYLEKISGVLTSIGRELKANPKTYIAAGIGGGIVGAVGSRNTKKRLEAAGKPMTRSNALKDQLTHII